MCQLPPESAVYANGLFRGLYNGIGQLLPGGLCWLDYFIAGFVIVFLLVNALLIGTALFVWAERRLIGRFQVRLGPNRWGPFGLGQPFADLFKFVLKEDVVPTVADRVLFTLAPVMMVAPLLLMLAVIPFGRGSFLADLNVGVLYLFALAGVTTMGILVAGWASGNKYATLGAMRGVAQLVSYEVPVITSLLGVVLMATIMPPPGAQEVPLSLVWLVEHQRLPFLLLQPLACFILVVGLSAEMNRSPFDIVEAESELVAGYHTEYGGVRFALIQLAEFAAPLVWSAVLATVFLQGYRWPVLPSHLWFLLKTLGFVFLFIWLRATLPRLRVDQIMGFAWKFLLPLALVNLVVTAVEVRLVPQPTTAQLWLLVGVNWAVAVVALVGWAALLQVRRPLRPTLRVRPAAGTANGAAAAAREV